MEKFSLLGLEGFDIEKKIINGKEVPIIKIDPSKVNVEVTEHPDGKKDIKIVLPRLNMFGQTKEFQK